MDERGAVVRRMYEAVNRGGTSFVFRAMEESGASAADVMRACIVVSQAFGLAEIWNTSAHAWQPRPVKLDPPNWVILRPALPHGRSRIRWKS